MHSVFDERPLAQATQVIVYSGRIIYDSVALQGGQPISDEGPQSLCQCLRDPAHFSKAALVTVSSIDCEPQASREESRA